MTTLKLAARMTRLGTETAFEVLARANALVAEGRDIINLGIGQPDFPTPGNIVEAGRKALADGLGWSSATGGSRSWTHIRKSRTLTSAAQH